MAKQKSIFKLEGTIGDVSFYRTKDGYLAREKTSITADRIATDPKFQRTRENGAEFGRAGAAGKVLRRAFKELIQTARDNRMVGRMTKEMVKVIQADAISRRGMRNVLDGELEMLTGFNFNLHTDLDMVVSMPYESNIDRATGICRVDIPVFDPEESIEAPGGTTHYKLVMGAAAIDFEMRTFETGRTSTDFLDLNTPPTAPLSLEITLGTASTHPLFLVLGIVYFQEINTVYYPLKNGAHNALALVKINGV